MLNKLFWYLSLVLYYFKDFIDLILNLYWLRIQKDLEIMLIGYYCLELSQFIILRQR